MKRKLLFIILLGLFFLNATVVNSQSLTKNKFNSGLALPSGFYAGFDHRFVSYSFGVDVSTWLGTFYPIEYFALTFDNSYYFGKPDKFEYQSWFLNGRVVYSSLFEKFSNKPVLLSLVPGLGKDFNLTPAFGLSVTVGIDLKIYHKDRSGVAIPIGTYYDLNKNITPNLKLAFSYRF